MIFLDEYGADAANIVHSRAGGGSGGALASPTWSFECEEHLYTLKHGEGHEPLDPLLHWFAKSARMGKQCTAKLDDDAEK